MKATIAKITTEAPKYLIGCMIIASIGWYFDTRPLITLDIVIASLMMVWNITTLIRLGVDGMYLVETRTKLCMIVLPKPRTIMMIVSCAMAWPFAMVGLTISSLVVAGSGLILVALYSQFTKTATN